MRGITPAEQVRRAVERLSLTGLRYHAERSLCPDIRWEAAWELQIRLDRAGRAVDYIERAVRAALAIEFPEADRWRNPSD